MLLSLSKSATTTGLEASEWVLLIAGIVLLVGIIGEYELPSWHHRLKLFELLVLIGVLFELLADGGVFFFSRRLQILEGADIEALDRTVSGARDKANTAREEAAAALADLKEARELAAKAEKGTATLTTRFSDRVLSDKQAEEISTALKPFNGQEFGIATYWDARNP